MSAAGGAETPLVAFEGVTLAFGGVTALSDVTFDVRPGELFAVIGPNGAGKTSIFNCLSGVYRPKAGSIRFEGERIDRWSPVAIARRGVARTFQNLALFNDLTVLDNVMLGRHHRMTTGYLAAALWLGKAKREELAHRAHCEEILELLELEGYRFAHVATLPYGVRKRLELARALAMEPKLLLLDEPVAGMNQEESEDMARFILEIRRELGLAVLLVEHDMHLVMDLADRVLALDFGRVLRVGTPDEVRGDAAVVEAYLGVAG
ncbi:MAG TPA: ABC transporter ATP-binding protein [Gemmatimonadaceae bacterium]|nr:ABC transporter ATP-binding protein [Gemmatimonadaceae bacterium]